METNLLVALVGKLRPEKLILLLEVPQPASIRPRLESRSPDSQLRVFSTILTSPLKILYKVKTSLHPK